MPFNEYQLSHFIFRSKIGTTAYILEPLGQLIFVFFSTTITFKSKRQEFFNSVTFYSYKNLLSFYVTVSHFSFMFLLQTTHSWLLLIVLQNQRTKNLEKFRFRKMSTKSDLRGSKRFS